MTRQRAALIAAAVFLLMAIAACSVAPAALVGSPTPTPTPAPEDLADEIRFRTTFGLRADEAWIRQVAKDPAARAGIEAYSVPLTAAEKAALDARSANAREVAPVLQKYGRQHADEWAGVYIESAADGVVVAQFTGGIAQHTAAIARLVNPRSRYRIQVVRYSLIELKRFENRIGRDTAWFQSIGADLIGYGLDVQANKFWVKLATANKNAPVLLAARYGVAEDYFNVDFRPPLWKGGHGTLLVRVVDRAGKPLPGLACRVNSVGSSDITETDENGRCEQRHAAAAADISVEKNVGEGRWKRIGRGRVTVPANGRASITIAVDLWGPLAVVPPQDGADTARSEGTLRITDSCVFVERAGERVLLIWPADRTAWDAHGRTITFVNFDGTMVGAGDGTPVVLGGGGDSNDESGSTTQAWLARTEWVAPPAASCPLESRWWVGELTP